MLRGRNLLKRATHFLYGKQKLVGTPQARVERLQRNTPQRFFPAPHGQKEIFPS